MGLLATILRSFTRRRRKRKKRRSGAVSAGDGFRPSDGAGGKVVVASLFGSGGADISERIAGILASETGFQTLRLKKVLRQNMRLAMLERLLAASDEGGTWLKEEKADLLVWGEMEDMGTVARLHFLAPAAGGDGQPGVFGLADTLDLPVPWPDGTAELVRAVTIAALLPVAQGAKRDLADRLKVLLPAADKVADTLPPDTPFESRASVFAALGNAHATALRFGNKKALAGAVKCYEGALKLIDAAEEPLAWALVQTHLGAVLEADARFRKDPSALEAAVERYRSVTEALSRDSHGFDWALAHVRRAMALYKLASMVPEKTSAYLKDAVNAFEEALTVYDRTLMPQRWAEVMNHYGVVQMALGGYGTGNAMLQQAISTFRKVMEVRKRDAGPVLWAQTANNLGAACFALAKRTKEEHLLEEAATSFEGAAEVYAQTPGQKKRAEIIENNLMRVRRMLGADAA